MTQTELPDSSDQKNYVVRSPGLRLIPTPGDAFDSSGPARLDSGERARLAAVRRYQVLDTPPDGVLDGIADLAALLLDAPVAMVSIVDQNRVWFKARHGLDIEEVGAEPGLCRSAIEATRTLVIPDTSLDPVATSHPLVTGEPGLRFYAGAPLTEPEGHNLGTLCILDVQPRELSEQDVRILEALGEIVVQHLGLCLEAKNDTRAAINTLRAAFDVLQNEHEATRATIRRHTIALAHEVRTPLNAIQSLSAAVEKVDRETAVDLSVINDAATQALEIVNQELALSTRQEGHATVRLQETDVPSLLSALKAIMDHSHAAAPGVELVLACDPDVPTIYTDQGKLAQILRNLVSNALVATVSGEVRVRAHLAEDERLVAFTVTDTGPGVPVEHQSRIFEEFAQVGADDRSDVAGKTDDEASDEGDGNVGFGLPTSLRLARLLGGDLTLDTTSTEGASFTATVAVTFETAEAGPEVEILPE